MRKIRRLSGLTLVGVLAVACDNLPNGDGGTGGLAVSEVIRECPHTQDWGGEDLVARVVESELNAVTRGAQHVPEYNDCQRFITGTPENPAYGSLYAIFAIPDDSLDEQLVSMEEEYEGREGLAAAVIWSRGGTYAPLGIQPGFNCLVLSRVPGEGASEWSAAIHKAAGTADCSGTRDLGGDPQLDVRVDSPTPNEEHYPPVARWGFDETESIWSHYIVIKCGAAVCYVGPQGFTPRQVPSAPESMTTDEERRVYEIALWHDEQPLAAARSGSGTSGPLPAGVHGTVVPHPDVGRYNSESDFANQWVTVAEVFMSKADSDYVDKLYFAATTTPGTRNVIQSCKVVGSGSCDGVPASLDCSEVDNETGERWRTRHIRAGDGAVKHFCVKRYPLGGADLDVPAAARWRWLASDEMTWHRCLTGCCDEQPS
jgi:hypothetical protein